MKISKIKAEIIDALQLPKVLVLYRNADSLSSNNRAACNTGTWLVKIVRGQEVTLSRINWRSIEPMLKEGFLEEAGERPQGGKLYKLSKTADILKLKAKEKKRPKRRRAVFNDDIQAFAAKYQCKIKYNALHRWYELSRLDGKEIKKPYIAYNKRGAIVFKLSDMSLEEWEETIKMQSEWVEPCNQNDQNEMNTEQADQQPEE